MNKGIFALFLWASLGMCQAESLVKFPVGPATWTVACTKKGESGSDGAVTSEKPGFDLKRVDVAQNDSMRRSTIQWSNGKSRELWSLANMDVIVTEDPSGQTLVSQNTLLFGDPFSPSNFDWIKSGTRASEKTVSYEGKDCNHYKGFIVVPNPTGEGAPETIACEAWIDAKTLLPVGLQKGNTLGIFTFGEAPADFAMPDRFRSRLEYYKITMGMR